MTEPLNIKSARFTVSGGRRKEFPQDDWPQVAFAGRSNVGKSSLINALVRLKRLAHSSRTPGRTQRINFFLINETLYFVDLPGYGYAKVPDEIQRQWRPMIEQYLLNNDRLAGVVVLMDARRAPMDSDLQLIDFLSRHDIRVQVAITKVDKLKRSERARQIKAIREAVGSHAQGPPIPFSTIKHEGREAVLSVIADWIVPSAENPVGTEPQNREGEQG